LQGEPKQCVNQSELSPSSPLVCSARVRQDRKVKKATKGLRAPKENRGRRDLQARRDSKGRQGDLARPVPTVRVAASVRPDRRVRPVHRAPPGRAACTRSPSRHAAPDATSSAASAKGLSPSPARAVPFTSSKVTKRTRRRASARRGRQSRYACITKPTLRHWGSLQPHV
jgi:hypothetical protein